MNEALPISNKCLWNFRCYPPVVPIRMTLFMIDFNQTKDAYIESLGFYNE